MPLRDVKHKYDQTILKVYGYGANKKIKLINMNCLRTSGIECELDDFIIRGSVNNEKLDESIIRSKNKIFELAYCNPWDYFFTGTLNPKKYDRTDLSKYHKDFTQWLRDQSKKLCNKIDFLLIPELHSDGKSWHLHGFIRGLPDSELKQFSIGDKMGKILADKVYNGDIVYNWCSYEKKFGFCDLEPIRNTEAVSKYITKYINKNIANSVKELNAHLYYHSRGLKMAETIKKGSMNWTNIEPSFKNDYCTVAWIDYTDSTFDNILNRFI